MKDRYSCNHAAVLLVFFRIIPYERLLFWAIEGLFSRHCICVSLHMLLTSQLLLFCSIYIKTELLNTDIIFIICLFKGNTQTIIKPLAIWSLTMMLQFEKYKSNHTFRLGPIMLVMVFKFQSQTIHIKCHCGVFVNINEVFDALVDIFLSLCFRCGSVVFFDCLLLLFAFKEHLALMF